MPGPSSDELRELAEMRLQDAKALIGAERYAGAYYLAGYAVECGLKAIIARSFRQSVIPDRGFVQKVYSHDLNSLVALADLKNDLEQRTRQDALFDAKWSFVSDWSEASRYEMIWPHKALMMVSAVDDEQNGVLSWLRNHW